MLGQQDDGLPPAYGSIVGTGGTLAHKVRPEEPTASLPRHVVRLHRGLDVLADDPWMTRCDPEQGQRRAFREATVLLPVPQCMNADTKRTRELTLTQSHELPQGGDVSSCLKLPGHEASTLPRRDRSSEFFFGQFSAIAHDSRSM